MKETISVLKCAGCDCSHLEVTLQKLPVSENIRGFTCDSWYPCFESGKIVYVTYVEANTAIKTTK